MSIRDRSKNDAIVSRVFNNFPVFASILRLTPCPLAADKLVWVVRCIRFHLYSPLCDESHAAAVVDARTAVQVPPDTNRSPDILSEL